MTDKAKNGNADGDIFVIKGIYCFIIFIVYCI